VNDIIPEVTMNIPVLLEPIPTGFRATTGAPLNLAVEAPTEDTALDAIQAMFAAKHSAGAKIVELAIPTADRMREIIASMAANPCFDDWVAETKKYRRQREAEEDAVEAEKARAIGGSTSTPQQQEPAA